MHSSPYQGYGSRGRFAMNARAYAPLIRARQRRFLDEDTYQARRGHFSGERFLRPLLRPYPHAKANNDGTKYFAGAKRRYPTGE